MLTWDPVNTYDQHWLKLHGVEVALVSDRNDPAQPTRYSSWPGGGARPRSATVAVRRIDGGLIGT